MYSVWTGRVDVEGGVEARAGVSQLAVLRCPSWGLCSPGGGPGSECGDGPDTAQVHLQHTETTWPHCGCAVGTPHEPRGMNPSTIGTYAGWARMRKSLSRLVHGRPGVGGEPGTAGSGFPAAVAVVFPRSRFGGRWWCLDDRRLSPQVGVVLCRASRAASLRLAWPDPNSPWTLSVRRGRG